MDCPGADIDFFKDRLEVVHGSRVVTIYIRGYNFINRDGTFEDLQGRSLSVEERFTKEETLLCRKESVQSY